MSISKQLSAIKSAIAHIEAARDNPLLLDVINAEYAGNAPILDTAHLNRSVNFDLPRHKRAYEELYKRSSPPPNTVTMPAKRFSKTYAEYMYIKHGEVIVTRKLQSSTPTGKWSPWREERGTSNKKITTRERNFSNSSPPWDN